MPTPQRLPPARAHGLGEVFEHLLGGLPVDAGVGDALAVGECGWVVAEALVAGVEVALDHHGSDGLVTGGDLFGEVGGDFGLVLVIFEAVAVGAVDHQLGTHSTGVEKFDDAGDGVFVEVGAGSGPAENEMAVVVAGGFDDGAKSLAGGSEEVMAALGGLDGVGGDLDAAAGAVFEPNGHGEAGCELAVVLAFGGACTDGPPGNDVGEVLRADGVEKLSACWHAHGGEVDE